MKRTTTAAISLCLGLAASAAAFAGHIEAGDRLEMAAVLKAPITPTQAVRIAEDGGGTAFTYGMEANRRGAWYEVSVLRGDAKLLLRIDSKSGKVLGSGPARGEDAHGAHALAGGRLDFGEAIALAERAGKGPALEANAAGHGAGAYVDVDVIEDHGLRVAHYRVAVRAGRVRTTLLGSDS